MSANGFSFWGTQTSTEAPPDSLDNTAAPNENSWHLGHCVSSLGA